MNLSIVDAQHNVTLLTLINVNPFSNIYDVKKLIHNALTTFRPERQGLMLELDGSLLNDEAILNAIDLKSDKKLYLKDLGPQVNYTVSYLCESLGSLLAYLLFYKRPRLVFGVAAKAKGTYVIVHLAAACWCLHYVRRVLETIFVHHFSRRSKSIRSLIKSCAFYWIVALLVSFQINRASFKPPRLYCLRVTFFFILYLLCEAGNMSTHFVLKKLRPKGSHLRGIPYPNSNPLTKLFNYVSCPNYTYEMGSWLSFSLMTGSYFSMLYTLFCSYQMTVWARQKHEAYNTIRDYPKERKSIIPYLL